MNFELALASMKEGNKLSREAWKIRKRNMIVVIMPALQLPPFSSQAPGSKVNDRTAKFIGKDTALNSLPYFASHQYEAADEFCKEILGSVLSQNDWQPGWLPSAQDLLADDWYVTHSPCEE